VAKLMTVYVESMRNVPVLILILLFSAAFDGALPVPRQATPMLDGAFVATNRGFYFPQPVFEAGSVFVVLAFIAAIIGAVRFSRYALKRQQQTGEHLPVARINVAGVAIVSVLAYLVMGMPISLEFPELQGFNFQGGLYARNSLMALWLALSIYTGAFIAENVRAGIQAVSHGQSEAAFALGLRPGRTMSLIVLPQALRVIIPPLISQYLNLTKKSSLALAVGYMDATGTLGGITLNQTGKEMETLLLLMTFYLSISLSISFVMNLYNENVKLVERTSITGGGFSVLSLFGAANGKWEMLKKGDAKMHDNYGVAGWLNLVVLLYLASFLMMLYYVFLDGSRASYFLWSYPHQIVSLLLIIFSGATMVTCLFKNYRVVDLAVFELVLFLIAVFLGLPFGEMTFDQLSTSAVVFGGLAARLAAIGYIVFSARSNITYFHRVREGEAS
jgi:general L-amino acid transport system permease protein